LDKELKRQIKEDEVLTGAGKAWAWIKVHEEQVRLGAIVAAVVVVIGVAFWWFQQSRNAAAAQAFSEALTTFEARVGELPPGSPAPAPGTHFTTANEKFTKALASFDGVVTRYGSFEEGQRATLYGALCRIELGRLDEARKALEGLTTNRTPGVGDQARLALAGLHARSGAIDKAVEVYSQLADDPRTTVPRDFVLMSLAGVLEDAKRSAEAGRWYKRVAEDYPESALASEARRRQEYLKSPVS
jgi:hypothetical protein